MANLQTYLSKILSAVYGKDVRQAIHDSIKQCWNDCNTAASAITVEVSNKEPTKENINLWINPDERDVFGIPELKDDEISSDDTWSSERISDKISTVEVKWNKGQYLNKYGQIIHDESPRMISDLIPCYEGVEISFIAETDHDNISAIIFYDSNENIVASKQNICEKGTEYTMIVPEGARFLRLSSATTIGWSLRFSESPVCKQLRDASYLLKNFENDVDMRVAYDHVINGVSQLPYYINSSGITYNDDGTITIAPEGYYFVTFACGAFGGNAYIGVKYDRDERIDVGFSENGTTTLTDSSTITSKKTNGYEIVKIDRFDSYDYPYAIIRIDNRKQSDTLTISEIKIVDGDTLLPNKPFYVATNGSDDNDGSIDKPFATVNRALLKGASNIYVLPGIYEQTINLGLAHYNNISISSYSKDGRVIFRDTDSVLATSETLVAGYSNVYSISTKNTFSDRNIWIFQDGIDDKTTIIEEDDRHPLQRGYKYRCGDTKISLCKSTSIGDALEEIETGSEYKWFIDTTTSTLYFSRPSTINADNPLCCSTNTSLFKNRNRVNTLYVSGIESKYLVFDVSGTTNSIIKDCKATNVCGPGAFMYDQALSCEFIRCEAARCFSGSNGDGFNAHSANTGDIYSKQTTVSLIDCWSHDNNDDGYSDHERSETTIIGGLYEWNGKAGVTPSYGSHCTCYNVYSRNNYAGFYYTGEIVAAEGGQYGQMYCHNCIAENNNRGGTYTGFRVDGAGNSMILVGCKAIGNSTGYAIGNVQCKGKLIDCSGYNNGVAKSGNFEIVNTTIIS